LLKNEEMMNKKFQSFIQSLIAHLFQEAATGTDIAIGPQDEFSYGVRRKGWKGPRTLAALVSVLMSMIRLLPYIGFS
jgi:hypothetical protein